MLLLKPMPKNKTFKSRGNSERAFSTIDDVLEMVPVLEELASVLREIGERKHPLAVRKGVTLTMIDNQKSVQIKGHNCTYFLDVKLAKTGKKWLRITQSHKAEGDTFERSSIFLSPNDAEIFVKRVAEMIKELE